MIGGLIVLDGATLEAAAGSTAVAPADSGAGLEAAGTAALIEVAGTLTVVPGTVADASPMRLTAHGGDAIRVGEVTLLASASIELADAQSAFEVGDASASAGFTVDAGHSIVGSSSSAMTVSETGSVAILGRILVGDLTVNAEFRNAIAPASVIAATGVVSHGSAIMPGSAGTFATQSATDQTTPLPGAGLQPIIASRNETVAAGEGSQTLVGGSFTTLFVLGSGADIVFSAGADTILAGQGSATVDASGTPLFSGGSGGTLLFALGASATLLGAGSGTVTVNAGTADVLAYAGAGGIAFNAGTGASTIVGGSGGATLAGGAGGTLYFGGAGPTRYVAGAATDTIVATQGGVEATGGANGTVFFTDAAGGDAIGTGSGSSTITAFGAGDRLTATGSGADVIAAAGASSTIDGTGASGASVYFAFGESDVVLGGAGPTAIESGLGDATLIAGRGATLFNVLAGAGARQIGIGGFDGSRDFVRLQGYVNGAGAGALGHASSVGGDAVLTLSDGTRLTFFGATGLSNSSFV